LGKSGADSKKTLRLGASGLLIDLLRLVPGDEGRWPGKVPDDPSNLSFFVVGEWDILHVALVRDLFPKTESSKLRRLGAFRIQNRQTLIAHTWALGGTSSPPFLESGPEGEVFSSEFRSPELPITLLLCLKLDPRTTRAAGLFAEAGVVEWVCERAGERGLLALPCGGLGWQELIFLVRGRSFAQARELVRDVYDVTASEIISADLCTAGTYPVTARTVTYPCISLDTYLGESAGSLLGEKGFHATLLLDLRPGIQSPLGRWEREKGDSAELVFTEQFGDYDAAFSLPANKTLGEVLGLVRELRSTNLEPPYRDWLLSSATVLDFEALEEPLEPKVGIAHEPLAHPLEATRVDDLLEKLSKPGVSPLQIERLRSILTRITHCLSDPVLSESVSSIGRYLYYLTLDLDQRFAGGVRGRVEPAEIDLMCNLLEFALRQRAEGLQQFLFNALPTSYYGRGGLNRLIVGADAILQEVYDLFHQISPGFVVFGVPNEDGFACWGPIVTAPIATLYELQWWWVLYHEAANHIDTTLFSPEVFAPEVQERRRAEEAKLVPDLVTLALPFRFDLELFSKMHAARLASVPPKNPAERTTSVGLRVCTLFMLRRIVRRLWPTPSDLLRDWRAEENTAREDNFMRRLDRIGNVWQNQLLEEEDALRDRLPGELYEALATFLSDLAASSPEYRKAGIPTLGEIGPDVQEGLISQSRAIRRFWRAAYGGLNGQVPNRIPLTALGCLVKGLVQLYSTRSSSKSTDLESGTVEHDVPRVADVVHRSIERWRERALGPMTRTGAADPKPTGLLQEKLADCLAIWHRALLASQEIEDWAGETP